MFAFVKILKEPVTLTATVSVTPCYFGSLWVLISQICPKFQKFDNQYYITAIWFLSSFVKPLTEPSGRWAHLG